MNARRLAAIAGRQRGLFTRADARECGYSVHQIRQRIAGGEWRPVMGRVLVANGAQLTQSHHDLAAHLAVPGSVLAGPSAAREWGMPVDDRRIMLLVQDHRRVRLPGVLTTYGRIGPREVALLDGARVTLRERAIFDCLRVLSESPGRDLLDRALQQGWTSIEGLGRQISEHVGQRGLPKVRQLLAGAQGGERSAAERALTGLLRGAGITGWMVNAPVRDEHGLLGFGDIVFPRERLVVEADGFAFHVTPERFQLDRARQNRLVAAGWKVLRFTWQDLTKRPAVVVAAVARLLQGR